MGVTRNWLHSPRPACKGHSPLGSSPDDSLAAFTPVRIPKPKSARVLLNELWLRRSLNVAK